MCFLLTDSNDKNTEISTVIESSDATTAYYEKEYSDSTAKQISHNQLNMSGSNENDTSSRFLDNNCQALSQGQIASDYFNCQKTLMAKTLDVVAKLGSRGISKRKVKPTWKVNEYLGVGDSDDIGLNVFILNS